jgi:GNAT superfamily N-acetyltransferase
MYFSVYRMAETLEIRRYEPRDKNAVWRVHERAFWATLPRFFPAVGRDLRDVPGAYLDGGEFLVGEVADEIVAIGGFRPVNERTVELKRLRVRPDCWRRGYGRTLVAVLEDQARERAGRITHERALGGGPVAVPKRGLSGDESGTARGSRHRVGILRDRVS